MNQSNESSPHKQARLLALASLVTSFLIIPSAYAELKTGMAADVVVGQPDFTSSAADNGGLSGRSLDSPETGAHSDGKRLFIVDRDNNRVLIWNSIPTTNFARADVVVGQPDFTSSTANNGGRSARTLSDPRGVSTAGGKLFVADAGNHRILIWHAIPATNFVPADVVVGQPEFASGGANNGGISARTLQTPRKVFSDGTRLFITDQLNHRI